MTKKPTHLLAQGPAPAADSAAGAHSGPAAEPRAAGGQSLTGGRGPNVLEMRGIRVEAIGGEEILHGIDLTVRRGEMLGLVGESGSGKTTAGLAAMGHFRAGLRQTGGTSTIYPHHPKPGRETIVVEELSDDELRFLRGERIAYIPQDPALSLNPAIRVGQQILEVLEIHGYGSSAQERQARVAEVLADVGLPNDREYQDRWPHQLSGGQQQRIGIAMAFAMYPDVLILDEPTTGLDVSTQAHVLETIKHMTERNSVAGIYITHDLAVVADVTDRVAVMLRGDIVEEGPAEQVLHSPQHPYTQRLLNSVPDLAGRRTLGAREAHTATGLLPQTHEAVAADSSQPALRVRNVRLSYGSSEVLRGISLSVERGRCTMLLGESGSGKTTLSRSIAGLIDNYTGSVELEGVELPRSARKRSVEQLQGLQYVFQSPFSSLNPRRTIGESLLVPLEMNKGLSHARRREYVEEALDAVRLGRSFYDRRPGDLSGGERQRAAIARALVNAPNVLICDEVTSALDVSVQASIIGLLRRLKVERGLAMLFVTHNITLARHIADDIAVLNEGEIVDFGPVQEVFDNPSHEYTRSLLSDVPTL